MAEATSIIGAKESGTNPRQVVAPIPRSRQDHVLLNEFKALVPEVSEANNGGLLK